jgi:hypothetical protein
MKFTTHNQHRVGLNGTMMVGTMQAQLRQLTQVFGQPMSNDPRVAAEWRLRFDDGLVASIYTWNQPLPEQDAVATWRIGGAGQFMVARVHEVFRSAVIAAQNQAREHAV